MNLGEQDVMLDEEKKRSDEARLLELAKAFLLPLSSGQVMGNGGFGGVGMGLNKLFGGK